MTTSAAGTRSVAEAVASISRQGDVVVLSGDLGAGKTTFTQGFVAALGISDPVTSPTFAILQHYQGPSTSGALVVNHLDVYRLASLDEAEALGLDELLDGTAVTLIEWGEGIGALLPVDRVTVTLSLEGPEASEASTPGDAAGPSEGVAGSQRHGGPLDRRVIELRLEGQLGAREQALHSALNSAVSDDVAWEVSPC
ncbi:MAG: tRNA (adenosine(37)-N6)-threonylcarbamoyltransferase complex ATPase subunit type 1 TsaE [Microthrixaceae bacterium]